MKKPALTAELTRAKVSIKTQIKAGQEVQKSRKWF